MSIKTAKLRFRSCTNTRGDGKYGFVDTEGREAIPLIYDTLDLYGFRGIRSGFVNGLARVGTACEDYGFLYGYIDKTGRGIIPCIYFFAESFITGGLARVGILKENGLFYGYIDKTGREVIPLIYEEAQEIFGGDLAGVKKNGRYGVIDTEGRTVIPFVYDRVTAAYHIKDGIFTAAGISDGRLAAELDGKSGIIDRSGTPLTPFAYDHMDGQFINGRMRVGRNGKFGLIDTDGREAVPCEYDDIWWPYYTHEFHHDTGLITFRRGSFHGAMDKDGVEVIPCIYDYILAGVHPNVAALGALIYKDNKVGYAGADGRVLMPPVV
jgi:uncharacterized protein YqkB